MADSQQVYAEEPSPRQTDGRTQSAWTAVAPPITWWWIVIAGAAALIIVLGFLYLVQLFARPLSLFVLGIAIATSLAPPVDWLRRWLPRTLAVILLYVVLLLTVIAVGWATLPGFVGQIEGFSDRVPQFAIQAQEWIDQRLPLENASVRSTLTSWVSRVSGSVLTLPLAVAETILAVFLVIFISLYSLIVAPHVQKFLLSLLPTRRRAHTQQVLTDMGAAMGGYVRGVILSGLIIGVFTYLGLLALGVDYPLVLAVTAGALEVVPILGTLISSLIIVGVALLQSPQLALFTLLFVVILQLIEGNIIFPTVQSSQTNLSPLLGLLAFFAGSVVGGLLGALVAIPLAAALRVVVIEVFTPMVRRWTGAVPATDADQSG